VQIGNRVIFDQDGRIIFQTGEMQGDVSHGDITSLDFVDIEYGAIDLTKYRIVSVNPSTKQPVLEEIPVELTPEQQRIQELEDQLLLMADAETGGIL